MFAPGTKVRIHNPGDFWHNSTGVITEYEPAEQAYGVKLDTGAGISVKKECIVFEVEVPIGYNEYYKDMGIQPFDVVDTWPDEQRMGAYRAFALKYIMRMGRKEDNLTQAKKAIDCLEHMIKSFSQEAK